MLGNGIDLSRPLVGKVGKRQLVKEQTAAEYLGVSRSTMQQWRHYRRGPKYFKLGNKRILYDLTELEAWIESQLIDPEAV